MGEFVSRESRVAHWVTTRIGAAHMHRKERVMRLAEEVFELAQSEGVALSQLCRQLEHVFARPAGTPNQEAGGVAVCLLGWCAAVGTTFDQVADAELARIEAKRTDEIRGSVARKQDADLVNAVD